MWNNQDENDDQQDIVNAFVDELWKDITTMALDQAEYSYSHNRWLETISANADAKETAEIKLESQVVISGESIEEDEYKDHED